MSTATCPAEQATRTWSLQTALTFAAAVAAAAVLVVAADPAQAQAPSAAELRAAHDRLKPALADSPFGRPLLLQSDSARPQAPSGTVYAVVDQPFAGVRSALQRPANWCGVLMLQHNVKRCVPTGNGLRVAIGRKHDQPAEQAFQVDFRWTLHAAANDHLSLQLAADSGPLGTRNYRLHFQAVPLDDGRSFVRMGYAYEAGVAARMATDAYLATSGRDKVGFSRAADGSLVGGVQGVAERNTMRYFLAIEAYLDSLAVPEGQRTEKRLRDWFAATERYPRQLHEMDLGEYLSMKRRELQDASVNRS